MAKRKKIRISKINMEFFWELGAKIIFWADIMLDKTADFLGEIAEELREIGEAGMAGAVDVGAALVVWYDKSAEIVEWFIIKTAVLVMRKYHDILLELAKHRRAIVKHFIIVLLVGVGVIAVFASAVDYEYAYNGRALGIVREQRDVLEILEMVSEDLSLEYGSNIVINP